MPELVKEWVYAGFGIIGTKETMKEQIPQ